MINLRTFLIIVITCSMPILIVGLCNKLEDQNPVNPLDPFFRPAIIYCIKDTSVAINDSIVLYAMGVDSQKTRLEFRWFIDTDTVNVFPGVIEKVDDSNYKNSLACTWSVKDTGMHHIRVQCINDRGLVSAFDTVQVYVTMCRPYLIKGCDSLYAPFDINDSIQLYMSAGDSNGTIQHYIWKFDNDTTMTVSSSGIFRKQCNDTGSHKVIVYALDDDTIASQVCTLVVHITAHIPTIITTPDTSVAPSSKIQLVLNAQDDRVVTVKEIQLPGTQQWLPINRSDTLVTVPDSPGTYSYTVRAKDDNGFYGYAQCVITVVIKESTWDTFVWDSDSWN